MCTVAKVLFCSILHFPILFIFSYLLFRGEKLQRVKQCSVYLALGWFLLLCFEMNIWENTVWKWQHMWLPWGWGRPLNCRAVSCAFSSRSSRSIVRFFLLNFIGCHLWGWGSVQQWHHAMLLPPPRNFDFPFAPAYEDGQMTAFWWSCLIMRCVVCAPGNSLFHGGSS